MIFLCFNCSPFFIFKFWSRKCSTVPLFCIVLCFFLYFHFSPYPRKLNDNEKLWMYGRSTHQGLLCLVLVQCHFFRLLLFWRRLLTFSLLTFSLLPARRNKLQFILTLFQTSSMCNSGSKVIAVVMTFNSAVPGQWRQA